VVRGGCSLIVATDRESEVSTQSESGVAFTLPDDFLTLPVRERREIVWSMARRRSRHRESTAEAIAHAYEDGEPAVVPALTVALEVDPDTQVKRHAAFGLGCIPEQAVVPALRGALSSTDRATKGHAILALGRLRAREALPDLAGLLDDTYARFLAADALVAIADERALATLRQAASHGSPLRRHRLRKRVSALETTLGARGSA
jgi:HEAT repeat protein